MSVVYCYECCTIVDTDFNCDHFDDNGRCVYCLEKEQGEREE